MYVGREFWHGLRIALAVEFVVACNIVVIWYLVIH